MVLGPYDSQFQCCVSDQTLNTNKSDDEADDDVSSVSNATVCVCVCVLQAVSTQP